MPSFVLLQTLLFRNITFFMSASKTRLRTESSNTKKAPRPCFVCISDAGFYLLEQCWMSIQTLLDNVGETFAKSSDNIPPLS